MCSDATLQTHSITTKCNAEVVPEMNLFMYFKISPTCAHGKHVNFFFFFQYTCRSYNRSGNRISESLISTIWIKAMTHQPTQRLSRVGSGPVGICVIDLQLDSFLHSSLIPDDLLGSRPPYDSTVELGWLMCHGLNCKY